MSKDLYKGNLEKKMHDLRKQMFEISKYLSDKYPMEEIYEKLDEVEQLEHQLEDVKREYDEEYNQY